MSASKEFLSELCRLGCRSGSSIGGALEIKGKIAGFDSRLGYFFIQ